MNHFYSPRSATRKSPRKQPLPSKLEDTAGETPPMEKRKRNNIYFVVYEISSAVEEAYAYVFARAESGNEFHTQLSPSLFDLRTTGQVAYAPFPTRVAYAYATLRSSHRPEEIEDQLKRALGILPERIIQLNRLSEPSQEFFRRGCHYNRRRDAIAALKECFKYVDMQKRGA